MSFSTLDFVKCYFNKYSNLQISFFFIKNKRFCDFLKNVRLLCPTLILIWEPSSVLAVMMASSTKKFTNTAQAYKFNCHHQQIIWNWDNLCNEQETLFLLLSKQFWCLRACFCFMCPWTTHFFEKRCSCMLKRIENSCYCSQMTSPPPLKQAFQLFTTIVKCNSGLAKQTVKTTTNRQKIIDRLFNRHCVHHYKVQ